MILTHCKSPMEVYDLLLENLCAVYGTLSPLTKVILELKNLKSLRTEMDWENPLKIQKLEVQHQNCKKHIQKQSKKDILTHY